jgi:hypothetical protein
MKRAGVTRVFLTDAHLAIEVAKLKNPPVSVILPYGRGWTYDLTPNQREALQKQNIFVWYDYPHAGNGFTVEHDIVELWRK